MVIIPPNTGYQVKCEKEKPYEYYMFEFNLEPTKTATHMAYMLTSKGYVVYQEEFLGFEPMFEKLLDEMNSKQLGYDSILYSGLLRILIHIMRAQHQDLALEFSKKKDYPQYSEVIYQVMSYVHAHLDEPIKIETISKAVGVSPNYLYKIFIATFKKSPSQYILRIKVHEAEKLLREHTYTIEEVARKLGFSSAYHFSKTFKETKGVSPKKYELETRN